jgi:hypothetical protein
VIRPVIDYSKAPEIRFRLVFQSWFLKRKILILDNSRNFFDNMDPCPPNKHCPDNPVN